MSIAPSGRVMVFDVESVGLHGEGFAVGWVVHQDGVEVSHGYAACPIDAAAGADGDRAWVLANVVPHLQDPTHETPRQVREAFWSTWLAQRERGTVLAADCGWPVEARFLAACIDDDPEVRRCLGPYPLHEVATAMALAGLDPLATHERHPSERPAHHPTADARQSARLLSRGP